MNVHQLSINYLAEQDRLLVRVNTSADEEFRLWLTRRLVLNFWPALNQTVLHHVAPGENAGQTAATDDFSRQMLSEFQRAQTLENADFRTPYKAIPGKLPLGGEPLVVTEINLTPLDKGGLQLQFIESLPPLEGVQEQQPGLREPRGFHMTLDPKLVHGLVHLLSQAIALSQWGQGAETLLPGGASKAGEVHAAPAQPRYLN